MEDSKQYRCFCNSMHVQRGAYIIGIVGTLLSILGLIFSAVTHSFYYAIINFLNILLYSSIIYAQKQQNSSYYWPFLIFNGIGIGFIIVILLVFGLLFVTAPEKQSPTDQNIEHANKGTQYGNVVLIAVLSNALFLAVWFQSVVYRAYKYMEMNETSIPTTHIKTENHKQDADTDAERCLKCICCTML